MWIKERKFLFGIGLLVLIAGIIPLIKEIKFISGYIEQIPSSGIIYQGIIIILGLLAMILGKPSKYDSYYPRY